MRTDFSTIPVLDFSAFTSADRFAQARLIRDLDRACREVGFFYLSGHGVDWARVEAVQAAARSFFSLPFAARAEVSTANSRDHRGYRRYGPDGMNPALDEPRREAFEMGQELPPNDPRVLVGQRLHGPNQWPRGCQVLQESMTALYQAMEDLTQRFMPALALAMGLERQALDHATWDCLGHLRVLRYPPGSAPDHGESTGQAPHTDPGCLGFLVQDRVGGLEVQNASGQWIAVPPLPGAFVVNTGELMARWSNDSYQPARHRVSNPSDRYRYAIPFFFDPSYDTLIEPLPPFVDARNPARYPPILAGDYLADVRDGLPDPGTRMPPYVAQAGAD